MHREICLNINKQNQYLTNILSQFETASSFFKWLPKDFHLKSQHVPIKRYLTEIRNSTKNPMNKKSLLDTVLNIGRDYIANFNPKFKFSSQTLKSISEVKPFEPFMSKLSSFRTELSLNEHKLVDLEVRKAQIETQHQINVDLEAQLSLNHELIESSLLACVDTELSQVPFPQNQIVFESLNYVLFQYLNDNLQKWILMENASLAAKDHLFSLTSIEGDWFLEEMLSLISNCNHLAQFLKKIASKYNFMEDEMRASGGALWLGKCLDGCESISTVFSDLKNLLFSYEINLNEEMLRLTFVNCNEANSTLEELKAMKIDEFFALISRENFNVENFHSVSKKKKFLKSFFSKLRIFKPNYRKYNVFLI